MSKVTVAASAGFCFGVDRAVKMVYSELEKNTRVATLGPIIHNQDVVNDMKAKGARIIDSVDELEPGETVVIRSHGVGRNLRADSRKGKQNARRYLSICVENPQNCCRENKTGIFCSDCR